MRRLLVLVVIATCALRLSAQSYTYHLTHGTSGTGTVRLFESAAIDRVVNGKINVSSDQRGTAATPVISGGAGTTTSESSGESTATDSGKKVVLGGQKVTGYRVQVFAGSNSRDDKSKAEAAGNAMKRLFPDQPVYVHFYSPRWICRIGNFRTYEEAEAMLERVKEAGYKAATLVKGTITTTD